MLRQNTYKDMKITGTQQMELFTLSLCYALSTKCKPPKKYVDVAEKLRI